MAPRFLAALLTALVLAACTGTTTSGPTGDGPTGDGRGEVLEVVVDVDYYGACGNETLMLPDGRRFYPLTRQERTDLGLDEAAGSGGPSDRLVIAAPGTARPGTSVATVLAVAPPGPGDDVGTLTVFDTGLARFDSDSGWLIWLTDTPRTYQFEC